MPTTYNGIGTHYYGKKNAESRPGTCPHCGRATELTSYDTRLWFVVVFIPVIPLGRKRIIDSCPSCRRHYVADADKWEAARQLEVSGAIEKFRSAPTPENALAAHQQLLNFRQFDEAATFRTTVLEKFADHAHVHAGLALGLAHYGKNDAAAPLFARALELRPDLPEARVGVARDHIRAGRYDEARTLLDFLEKPGAAQLYSLEPLETLALAYQRAGLHETALALFARLQEALPHLNEHKRFRATVAKSEKALGRKESQLPKLAFSWRRILRGGDGSHTRTWLGVGALVALIALGFVAANEYIRRHRTLHVVNAYPRPAEVHIPGVGDFTNVRGVLPVTLAEGRYHATISGPIKQEVDFEVHGDYFDRWSADPAWVLNLGGSTILIQQVVTYGQNPPPASLQVHFGQTFERFATVTHAFAPLPHSVSLHTGETKVLTDLQIFTGDGANLASYLLNEKQPERALALCESWLPLHPDDNETLQLYAGLAIQQKAIPRADVFFHTHLAERPLKIEWHRTYQNLHERPGELAKLIAEYDSLLRAEPTSSALLYLRGRIDRDQTAAGKLFERSAQTDPRNPYPLYALAYDRSTRADWPAARSLLARVVELRPGDQGFADTFITARLGVGEYAEIEREMRPILARNPLDTMSALHLIDALAAQARRDEAVKAAAAYDQATVAKYGAAAHDSTAGVRFHALYAAGDFSGLEKATAKVPGSALHLVEALIEQGRVAEAAKALPKGLGSAVHALALACANLTAGRTTEAERWIEQAKSILAEGNTESARAGALLAESGSTLVTDATDIHISPAFKALVITTLFLRHPETRAELAPLARRLNVGRSFPYHLVQRLTATAP